MSVVVVDPGMTSTNLGDQIISDAIRREFVTPLSRSADVEVIPMHGPLSDASRNALRAADEVVVCGTNLLSNHMRFRTSWEWDRADIELAKGKLTVFGAGWWQYQVGAIDPVSARWMKSMAGGRTWGVRDAYSAKRLAAAGVASAHISCPTLWRVSEQPLPSTQNRIIATFTDYNQDPLADRRLIDLLESRHDVLYWPQGPGDRRYIESISPGTPNFIDASLAAFDHELQQPDTAYVGLRLHGGIRALQFGVPSLILSIDNRAREISRSVGLRAPSRHAFRDIEHALDGQSPVAIELPADAIESWTNTWSLA
ncbi:polysaccharide pyruvyl transferase family protein [Cryobacterium adonitolivorans]|uniref:Polysaccharide pyruvyl transferase family protein n=1 Tax=Cryobacterium adonitolivorans TaxID=1259189 RepID=A0A4R8WA47_9MICO|nr:polysaccharide pyruvyl transferase family protein [Cryobacterium adonitolivorans]TFC05567.1 polysaccharide pyruvyl transferase family protein [Cryobacterium adonitolivorans]